MIKSSDKFSKGLFFNFCKRMHAIIGLMAGPFIFIAAITGALYAMAFATEGWFYKDSLFTGSHPASHNLAEQVAVANSKVKNEADLLAVRPAPNAQETTRVLYLAKNLESSEYRTLFVDPNTLELKSDLTTYGSSGAMPFRTTVDKLHRDLMLGHWGRWYSELAASWLWLLGFSGLHFCILSNRTLIGYLCQ